MVFRVSLWSIRCVEKTSVSHVSIIHVDSYSEQTNRTHYIADVRRCVSLLHLPANTLVLSHPVNTCIPCSAFHTFYQVIVQWLFPLDTDEHLCFILKTKSAGKSSHICIEGTSPQCSHVHWVTHGRHEVSSVHRLRPREHAVAEGARWPSGLERCMACTGDRTVREGSYPTADNFASELWQFRLPRFATVSFGGDAKSRRPFYLVSMPGEVKDPTSPHWNV